MESFGEKKDGSDNWINGGFFVLEPEVIDLVDDDMTSWEFGPLERLAAEGNLNAFKHTGFWKPMDTLRDKNELNKLWESNLAPWKIW